MSSSGEGERFKIGAHVDATDGRCGRLTRASGAGRAGEDAAPVHPSHSSKVGPPRIASGPGRRTPDSLA
jgi:hypothetical protein